jgi:hypothetical protein
VWLFSCVACGGRTDLGLAFAPAVDGSVTDATDRDSAEAAADATVNEGGYADGGLVVLASDQSCPSSIVVGGGVVYWTNRGGEVVERCAAGGCLNSPTSVSVAADVSAPPFVPFGEFTTGGVVVDDTTVFWTRHGGTVWSAMSGGGSATNIAKLKSTSFVPAIANAISLDESSLYWVGIDSEMPVLETCAKTGCGGKPTALAATNAGVFDPVGIAVRQGDLYFPWANAAVVRCATSGCANTPTPLVFGQSTATAVATDGTNVYWLNAGNGLGEVLTCPLSGCAGKPINLASGNTFPVGIAVDETNVYWTTGGAGIVFKCSITGCGGKPTVLATGQSIPVGIAVDATSVYWTNYGPLADGGVESCRGSVMKLTPK